MFRGHASVCPCVLETLSSRYLLSFGVGAAINTTQEEEHGLDKYINELLTTVFVEQPLASPGSAIFKGLIQEQMHGEGAIKP